MEGAGLRAGVYGRQSHGSTVSIDEQIDESTEDALEAGLVIKDTYRDEVSASEYSTKSRTDWPRLLADIDAGELDVVCLWESSRGDRTMESWIAFINQCAARRVKIRVTSDARTLDPKNPGDWKKLATDGVDSAFESKKTSLRVRRTIRSRAKAGRPHGLMPFGYTRTYVQRKTREMGTQVPDETTYVAPDGVRTWTPAGVVRSLYDWLRTDISLPDMCRRLTDLGVPPPRLHHAIETRNEQSIARWSHLQWTHQVIRELLMNKSYAGLRTHKREAVVGGSEWEGWTPIVSAKVYWEARSILALPKRRTTKGGRGAKYLLSNIARCHCGSPMQRNGARTLNYRCTNKGGDRSAVRHAAISIARLDELVEEWLVLFLSDPAEVARLRQIRGTDDHDAIEARTELDRLRTELEVCRTAAKNPNDRHTTWSDFIEMAKNYEPMIEQAEKRAQWNGLPDEVLEIAGPEALDRWLDLPITKKRRIVRHLLDIVVRPLPEGTRSKVGTPAKKRAALTYRAPAR